MQRLNITLIDGRTVVFGVLSLAFGTIVSAIALYLFYWRPGEVSCGRRPSPRCEVAPLVPFGRARRAVIQPARGAREIQEAGVISAVYLLSDASPLLVGKVVTFRVFPFSRDRRRIELIANFFRGSSSVETKWTDVWILGVLGLTVVVGGLSIRKGIRVLVVAPGIVERKGRYRIVASSTGLLSFTLWFPRNDLEYITVVSPAEARRLRRDYALWLTSPRHRSSRAFSQVIFSDRANYRVGPGQLPFLPFDESLSQGVLVVKVVGVAPVPIGTERSGSWLTERLAPWCTTSGSRTEDRKQISYDHPVSRAEQRALPQTDFDVFGLPMTASKREVVRRHRELVLQYHPDRVSEREKDRAHERMVEIQAAYKRLLACIE